MLSIETQQELEELIRKSGLMSDKSLDDLKLESIKSGTSLVNLIQGRHLIGDEELTKMQAKVSAVPYVNLSDVKIMGEALALLPKETAENYKAVPFGFIQGKLAMAMLDPANIQAVDFLARKTGKTIAAFMASQASIDRILNQYHADLSSNVEAAIGGGEEALDKPEKAKPTAQNLQDMVQDAPITRALNAILDYAAQSDASDIHIEPRAKELHIRYRVDGILQDTMTLPKSVEPALISRIKILSNLKIDEHRIPQDGQFQITSGNKQIDLRIAIAPVVWGEQVVIRLLNKSNNILTLDGLGFKGQAYRLINEGIHKPHGMILSTGPTGSGKSTTLYAAINEIKNAAINIVTLEDPVEYKMDGINQIQVNPDVGLDFASGLRSILRQDPNVVMVGEIRDKETAELAVQAALTGHVVFSTLHTNSAAGVLPRLLDMQIEPFLIASTVNTVIAQRLVRLLCPKCKFEDKATEAEITSINEVVEPILPETKAELPAVVKKIGYENLPLASKTAYTLYRAKGCSECTNGYRGRLGICEVFTVTNAIEKLLTSHATSSDVQAQAEKDGMITMKQDGYFKALVGLTTLEEVARVAADF